MGLWNEIKSWFGASPSTDAQDKAFKEAHDDPFTDEQLQAAIEQGELEIWPADLYKSVEDYEAENWDAGRESPKTPDEAAAENRGGI